MVGKKATITGWGAHDREELSTLATTLQAANVTIISHEKCKENYGGIVINPRKICAWDQGKSDTCRGDSGGPLVIEREGQ